MRLKVKPRALAKAFAIKVFAIPGTPSIKTCPFDEKRTHKVAPYGAPTKQAAISEWQLATGL
jgi:hypothetical protein